MTTGASNSDALSNFVNEGGAAGTNETILQTTHSAQPAPCISRNELRRLLPLLAVASVTSLFSDTSYLPIFAIFQPTFYLAYFQACSRSSVHWSIKYVLGWIVYCFFRAIPASDYFYYGDRAEAYFLGFVVIALVYGAVMLVSIIQCTVWAGINYCEEQGSEVSASVAYENNEQVGEPRLQPSSNIASEAGTIETNDSDAAPATTTFCAQESTPLAPPAIADTPQTSQSHTCSSKCLILNHRYTSPFVFPTLFTSIYQILFRLSPIGGAGNPAMGLAQVFGLRQVVSLFGEIFLVFWIGWLASIIVGAGFILGEGGWMHKWVERVMGKVSNHQSEENNTQVGIERSKIAPCHLHIFYFVTFFMFIYGSVRELVGRGMYLQTIEMWPTTQAGQSPLRVSCITRSWDSNNMIKQTNARLAAGDDLIMWSEGAGDVEITPDMFDWANSGNVGSVVVPTFYESISNDDYNEYSYNTMEMMQDGNVIASYHKNRPVPVMEPGVLGGSTPPQSYDVSLTPLRTTMYDDYYADELSSDREDVSLKLSMAICFDFDFPYLFREASNADLVIGASWYWSSIGYSFWNHNIFRAIENGFTLIKCAENGITGGVDPYGRTLAALPTLLNEVHLMEIPLQNGMKTLYSMGGWVFGWICVCLSAVVMVLFVYDRMRKGSCKCFDGISCARKRNYTDIPPVISSEGC